MGLPKQGRILEWRKIMKREGNEYDKSKEGKARN